MSAREVALAHLDPQRLHWIRTLAQSCGVHEPQWPGLMFEQHLDRITRRARHLTHDHARFSYQRVQQRRLPRVWRPCQHHGRSFSFENCRGYRCKKCVELRDGLRARLSNAFVGKPSVIFFRKVDVVSQHRLELERRIPR